MTTLQNELLQEALLEKHGEELSMLQEYLLEDIEVRIKALQGEILFYSEFSDEEQRNKGITSSTGVIRELNEFKHKVENRILEINFNEVSQLRLIHYKLRINSFKEYLTYKNSLKADTTETLEGVFNKLHETDTNKEVDAVSEALDKVEKVFNIVFNVSERSNKSANEIVDEIAKTIRTKGMW